MNSPRPKEVLSSTKRTLLSPKKEIDDHSKVLLQTQVMSTVMEILGPHNLNDSNSKFLAVVVTIDAPEMSARSLHSTVVQPASLAATMAPLSEVARACLPSWVI